MVKFKEPVGIFTQHNVREFVREGYWELGHLFWMWWDENAEKYPDKEAMVDSKWRLTWAQARQQAVQLALGFQELELKKDDVVVAELPNCVEAQILRNGLERIGVVYYHVARFRHKEMRHLLGSPEAVAVVIPGLERFEDSFDYFGMIQEIRADLPKLKYVLTVGQAPEGATSLSEIIAAAANKEVTSDYFRQTTFDFDEAVFLWYTSGTTGLPKITWSSSQMVMLSAKDLADRWEITKDDVFLAIGDISSGIGISAVSISALTGCKNVMLERWDPETGPERVLSLVEKERVTLAIGVPPHAIRIAQQPDIEKYDIASLRLFAWAGAPLPGGLVTGIEEKLGCKLVSFYGSQDNYWVSTARYSDSVEVRNFTVGKPGTHVQVRVVDENGREVPGGQIGELLVRSAGGGLGYLKDPEKTKEAWDAQGWYRTDDLAKLDNDGNIILVGRKTDVINRGGQKIYPMEVEDVLRAHPKVAEVCIVPIPDPILGQRACAYVEPKEGATFTFDEMIAHLEQQRMAKYKQPERLEVRDRLPRLPTGKVDKAAVAEDIQKKLEA